MKQGSGKLVAAILAILMLALPGTLSAANWRGIEIIVTTQDGRQYPGRTHCRQVGFSGSPGR